MLLKTRGNELEITVANLWLNRLIRDSGLIEEERLTWIPGKYPFSPRTRCSPRDFWDRCESKRGAEGRLDSLTRRRLVYFHAHLARIEIVRAWLCRRVSRSGLPSVLETRKCNWARCKSSWGCQYNQ